MYKCICKRCGHWLNRLFILPVRVRERWMFTCPICSHKSELAHFSTLSAKTPRSGKCLRPMLVAAARGWSENLDRLVELGQSTAGAKLKILAGGAIAKLRRRYGGWRCPHARRRRDDGMHSTLLRWHYKEST